MPDNLPPEIRHRAIAPMSQKDYSLFMLFALWRVIETEYVLIVQDDGWLIDINNWSDEFLKYDYVGAPVQLGRVDKPEGTYWMKDFSWYSEIGRPDTFVIPVLNGGFSLRSRRMLRALIDHPHIRMEIPPPQIDESGPIRMTWFHDAPNEDVQLTGVLRRQLEAVGMRFAPLEVASRFAFEQAAFGELGGDPRLVLGMHGTWRRLVSIDPPIVRYNEKRSYLADDHPFEPAVIRMLEERGYRLEFVPEST